MEPYQTIRQLEHCPHGFPPSFMTNAERRPKADEDSQNHVKILSIIVPQGEGINRLSTYNSQPLRNVTEPYQFPLQPRRKKHSLDQAPIRHFAFHNRAHAISRLLTHLSGVHRITSVRPPPNRSQIHPRDTSLPWLVST